MSGRALKIDMSGDLVLNTRKQLVTITGIGLTQMQEQTGRSKY